MRVRFLPLLALSTLAAAFAPHLARAQTPPVLPGYWQSDESYSVLFSGGGHARKCLTSALIQSFVAAPSNSHYRCTYASQEISGGQASYRGGACYSKSGRKVLSNVSVDGRYQPERFHLSFHFQLMVSAGGIGLPGSAEIDAHRIAADCPAGAAPQPATP